MGYFYSPELILGDKFAYYVSLKMKAYKSSEALQQKV